MFLKHAWFRKSFFQIVTHCTSDLTFQPNPVVDG